VVYLGKPRPETRIERLQASVKSYLRTNRLNDASRVELELAKEEKREPHEWAKPDPGKQASPNSEALRSEIRAIMSRAATPDQRRQAHYRVLGQTQAAGVAGEVRASIERHEVTSP
jgi:hypothetical protein